MSRLDEIKARLAALEGARADMRNAAFAGPRWQVLRDFAWDARSAVSAHAPADLAWAVRVIGAAVAMRESAVAALPQDDDTVVAFDAVLAVLA